MNPIKAVVLDIDGTLLTSKKEISSKTRDALIKIQEHGIKVILASGRPTPGMSGLVHTLKMNHHHGFLISYNGACVTDCESHDVIYNQPMNALEFEKLCNHLSDYDVIPMIAHDEYLYVNDVFGGMINISRNESDQDNLYNIIEYESRGGNFLLCELKNLSDLKKFPVFKVLIAADPVYLSDNIESIAEPFKKTLSCAFSAPFYFEFTDIGVDKAATLHHLSGLLDYTPSNIMAFGDGHNDLTMIQYAGHGVAMGNAEDEVKAIADEITRSHDDDGIAHSLYKQFPEIFLQ